MQRRLLQHVCYFDLDVHKLFDTIKKEAGEIQISGGGGGAGERASEVGE